MAGTATQIRPLIATQNKALRLICAAFRTSPIHALEIESAIPPLDIHLATIKQNAAIRLNKLPTKSPIIQRLPNTWRNNRPPTITPPTPTNNHTRTRNPKTTTLLKLAQQHDPNCERISTDIPPWTKTAIDLKGKLTIISSTCAKDKRKENAKKHNIEVKTHINDQSLLTIYTDGSKTKEGTGAGIIAYHKG
jgi:hypothetical protein